MENRAGLHQLHHPIMTSYIEKFVNQPHTHFFRPVDKCLMAVVANQLQSRAIKNRYVYLSDSEPFRFALSFFHLLDKGACPVPVGTGHKVPSSELYFRDGRWTEALATGTACLEKTYVCLTSGSTGEPKMVHLSVEGALANAEAHAKGFGLTDKGRVVQCLPIYHSYGLIAYLWTSIVKGIALDFYPGLAGLRVFKKNPPDADYFLHVSPAQARFILKDKFRSPVGLRGISVGGGALPRTEWKQLLEAFPSLQLYSSYGLTEAGPRTTAGRVTLDLLNDKGFSRGSYIGHSLENTQLRVLDDDSKLHSSGEGILCIKSPSLMLDLDKDHVVEGFLKTRDQVYISPSGGVFFISRADDIIKCGGITIYPGQMENEIRSIPGVRDVIVLKIADPLYEEVPILFVEGEPSKDDLEDRLRSMYPPHLLPREVHILEQFPRQSLNKINRLKLMEVASQKT